MFKNKTVFRIGRLFLGPGQTEDQIQPIGPRASAD